MMVTLTFTQRTIRHPCLMFKIDIVMRQDKQWSDLDLFNFL